MERASSSSFMIDVDEVSFAEDVLERSHEVPVVVDFWAPWCGPCRLLGPLLDDLARERNGAFVLAKVDIDRNPGLAETYGIQSIPAVKAVVDGQSRAEFVGLKSLPELRRWLEKVVPDANDRLTAEAEGLEKTDPTRAEAIFRQVLAERPRHERAAVGLTRVLLARGDDEGARQALRPAIPGVELRDEIERLEAVLQLRELARPLGGIDEARAALGRDAGAEAHHRLGLVLAAAGRYEEALEALLTAAKKDKKLGQNKVREAMVQVFFAIGPRDPLADRYRAELSRTIY